MPRLSKSLPRYRKHRASIQAVVTLSGKDFYLGPIGSAASRLEYDRLISEWVANGRRLTEDGATIYEMCAKYWEFAEGHYRKNGEPTAELQNIRYALRPLIRLYGESRVVDFGPLSLKTVRESMIDNGLSRGVINSRVGKIRRVFRWAVSEQLAPPSLYHALQSVTGLQRGRTKARETAPVLPVDDKRIDPTLPHLPQVVADMVRLQRLTGARPSEVCLLRPCDVDRHGEIWLYSPSQHKNEHHGQSRTIFLGPRAQAVLRQYLSRSVEAYCFSPAESELHRKAERRSKRRSKVQPSQRNRARSNPRRKPGEHYTRQSYLWAIRRACLKAFPPPPDLDAESASAWIKAHRWHPNQLRHSAATSIRSKYGLEAAQVVLGHSQANVTQLYAERDQELGFRVARDVG